VAKAYDFAKSGTGEYSVTPLNHFIVVRDDGTPEDTYATVGDTAKVKLTGDLPAPRVHEKRASFVGCSASQQSQISAAASSAQLYAWNALSYISGISNNTPRYTAWFGAYTSIRLNAVQNHFVAIGRSNFLAFKYDCTCTDAGTFAYVCAYIFQF